MNKHKSSIVKKFRKKDNICNICKKESNLSEDHIPPQSCSSAKNRVIYTLSHQMVGDRSFKPRISTNGISYKTICASCNNNLGKYDRALVDFTQKIESFVESRLTLPNSFDIECYPNAIMRSILGHLLAAKTETDSVIIDDIIRPSILNPEMPIHDDLHIFYWIYPYEQTVILRDFAMPAIRGVFTTSGFFNMIKFYPLAFLITHQLSSYENLLGFHQFNNISPNHKALLKIDLELLRKDKFPEDCQGDDNFLLLGRTANDSVYSLPKYKKFKT
jgi:hypothetical protein